MIYSMAKTFMALTEEVRNTALISLFYTFPPSPSGKSDPFAIFSLNGVKVHKSQVKKKTLSPEWNENFSVTVVRVKKVVYSGITNATCSRLAPMRTFP